ncbi:MAG: PaaI family thioesterase [Candidatus Heimdallarchaeota archaeon]|nr:PaaI family thioesterase [Candidatus Heimdallarchaeota archaeon]
MNNDIHYRKLENMYHSHPLNQFYNAKILIFKEEAMLELKLDPKYYHAGNAVHGSVYFKVLDDAAFFAANSVVEEVFLLTKNFFIEFIRPISVGKIIAKAKLLSVESGEYKVISELYNEDDKLIGKGTGKFVKSNHKLQEAMGYKI